jgi:predicted ATPase
MTASGEFDTSPVRAFLPGPGLRDGLELPAGLTVLVGENGSGKSTGQVG